MMKCLSGVTDNCNVSQPTCAADFEPLQKKKNRWKWKSPFSGNRSFRVKLIKPWRDVWHLKLEPEWHQTFAFNEVNTLTDQDLISWWTKWPIIASKWSENTRRDMSVRDKFHPNSASIQNIYYNQKVLPAKPDRSYKSDIEVSPDFRQEIFKCFYDTTSYRPQTTRPPTTHPLWVKTTIGPLVIRKNNPT